jgi:hypothetical protein
MVNDGVIGVAGHVQHFHLGVLGCQAVCRPKPQLCTSVRTIAISVLDGKKVGVV